jgi:hypothetical protein
MNPKLVLMFLFISACSQPHSRPPRRASHLALSLSLPAPEAATQLLRELETRGVDDPALLEASQNTPSSNATLPIKAYIESHHDKDSPLLQELFRMALAQHNERLLMWALRISIDRGQAFPATLLTEARGQIRQNRESEELFGWILDLALQHPGTPVVVPVPQAMTLKMSSDDPSRPSPTERRRDCHRDCSARENCIQTHSKIWEASVIDRNYRGNVVTVLRQDIDARLTRIAELARCEDAEGPQRASVERALSEAEGQAKVAGWNRDALAVVMRKLEALRIDAVDEQLAKLRDQFLADSLFTRDVAELRLLQATTDAAHPEAMRIATETLNSLQPYGLWRSYQSANPTSSPTFAADTVLGRHFASLERIAKDITHATTTLQAMQSDVQRLQQDNAAWLSQASALIAAKQAELLSLRSALDTRSAERREQDARVAGQRQAVQQEESEIQRLEGVIAEEARILNHECHGTPCVTSCR